MQRNPVLFIISGPSGSGKGTMLSFITDNIDNIEKVVNYTTRSPRPGEVDGRDYNFIDEDQFFELIDKGEIFEYERVYNDYYYGSPADVLGGDIDRVMELDYMGHRKYRKAFPHDVVSIFLLPPTFDEMQRRITERAEEKNLQSRLKNAQEQICHADEYDYVLLNEQLNNCQKSVKTIIEAERIKRRGEIILHNFVKTNSCE